jgi:radical SAM protein with 4Fe4S-binding SPASM domain
MNLPRTLFRLSRIFFAFKQRREVVPVMPIRLWVESASRCNLRCPMCLNKSVPAANKGVMPPELFKKIVDEARHFVKDMYLHHRGEPFLNPALFEMITLARQAGIRTRFHTNGSLMNAEKAEALLQAGPDLVSFSVDGFERASYEQVRVGAKFEITVDNIVRLVEMRRAMKLRKPYVVVEKIRFRKPNPKENVEQIAATRKRFLDAGVDEVIEKDEYTWTTEKAPEAEGPRTASACTFPWYAMVICADGMVTPCPQDFEAKMVMGNVNNSSLREIWNGEPYRALRRKFKNDVDSLPLCRKCDRLHRKTVGGVPFQYMITFLVDQCVGYGRLRKALGTAER